MRASPESISTALRDAGIAITPPDLVIEARDRRWLVRLPDDRVAWFPANQRGHARLAVERRILRLLTARCAFAVPRIEHEAEAGWDVRAIVPGATDPWALYDRAAVDRDLARRIGRALACALAEQHTRVTHADIVGWLPTCLGWPEPTAWIRERLPAVVDEPTLRRDIEAVLHAYDGVTVAAEDRVLVHGDLGFHNIALDPDSDALRGVFDYEGAAWADRHHDFRYFLFDREGEDMLEAALAVYEPAVGRTLSRPRIRLYNAVCAISFLAFRAGVPAAQKSCGRTLAEDLGWVRLAIARL